MVITILEANVAQENWTALEDAFRTGSGQLPSQIAQTFLIHSTNDTTVWRIMTVWQTREALDEYRRSVDTPGGILIFRAARAEPKLSVFDIVAHAAQ